MCYDFVPKKRGRYKYSKGKQINLMVIIVHEKRSRCILYGDGDNFDKICIKIPLHFIHVL